jgi:hypothetical protein
MKDLLFNLVATNSGWIARQALKYTTIGAAMLGGYLAKRHVDADLSEIITVGAVGAATFLTEQVLSFIAKKHAVK